jgi:hypothetical protein
MGRSGRRSSATDELAKRGQEIEQAREARAADTRATDGVNATRLAALSTTGLGFLRFYLGGFLVAMGTLLLVGWLVTLPAFGDPQMPRIEYALRLFAPFVAAPLVVLIARAIALEAGKSSLAGVLAWFAALPFPVIGLDRFLRTEPAKTFTAMIRPAGQADLARIASAVTGYGNRRISATSTDGAIRLVFDVASHGDDVPMAPATNYRGVRLLQGVIGGVLREVHAETPIASLELVE